MVDNKIKKVEICDFVEVCVYIIVFIDCVISDLLLKYFEVCLWNCLNGDLIGFRRIKIFDLLFDFS